MTRNQIRWLGAAIVVPALLELGAMSCVDTSAWDPHSIVGTRPTECTEATAITACNDGLACTGDICNSAGLCEHYLIPESMTPGSVLCDDHEECTIDSCGTDGQCQNIDDIGATKAIAGKPCWRTSCDTKQEVKAVNGDACETDTISLNDGYCYQAVCISCADAFRNGEETDVDCGGPDCTPCADGLDCHIDGDCLNGHCVEGICCNNICDAVCYSCKLPGSIGQCTAVPVNQPDDNPAPAEKCTNPSLCDGKGNCKLMLNEPCTSPSECLSGYCFAPLSICKIDEGDPCEGNASNCYTSSCDMVTKLCSFLPIDAPCTYHAQCGPGRICYDTPLIDICKVAEGSPCVNDGQCFSDYCNTNLKCEKKNAGDLCVYNDQCKTGNCFFDPVAMAKKCF